jgi:ketosteroid isomerase-like protein
MSQTKNSSEALEVAQKYFDALSTKNVETVISLCDDNITTKSPLGNLEGIKSFKDFTEGFGKMIIKLTPLSILGWDGKATIVYIADTYPVQNSYVVEYLTIENGKITSNTTIYDSVPFAEYAASQQKH